MKLGDVATVRSGLVLSRKQARGTIEMKYPLINLRSINPEGYIELEEIDIFEASELLSNEYLTRAGDLIIRLSTPYTAVLIDEKTTGMVVSSNFVIIRTDEDVLLPEYLFWLMNTSKVKRRIFENATTNMLSAIKPKYFADLEISLLNLENQRKIAEMNKLALNETGILRQLADEKGRYYDLIIDQVYREMKRGN